MTTLAPILEPDAQAMLRHLEQVFGGAYDGVHDGLIELAWTDPETRRLSHAELFGTDQLDDIAERAAALNRTPNCNVYIGATLRAPATGRGRRASDTDFYAASFVWADVDDDVVSDAVARCRAANLMPTMTVVTGRRPHTRAQFWWRLVEAERDSQTLRALNVALASALGGDPRVVNPGRVLRFGGSVAWPSKPGRVLERTEVHVPKDARPSAYWPSDVTRAFASPALPKPAPKLSLAADASRQPTETARTSPPEIKPKTPSGVPNGSGLAIGSQSVDTALRTIRSGVGWHETVVRLVAHWISRGWTDGEIRATAASLTAPGWPIDQTLRDLAPIIATARRKWNLPNPSHAIDDKAPPAPITIAWEDGSSAAMIPRRRWLIGSFAIRGQLTVLVAPPGAGKSTLAIALAVAAVTGRGELVGETIHETVKAWVWNNEDDRFELRRRLAAVMQHWSIAPSEIVGRLGLNSGSERPLLVAKATRTGEVLRLPDIDAVIERVRAENIGLLIVDPFVETHEVDENDNAQVKAVAGLWREVARRGDCAVVLVHHTGKPPAASPDAWAGSLSASRGASSLAGVARIMRTQFGMSERDAEKLGLEPEDRHRFVRLDDAKANLSLASGQARWFERLSVTIANGDEVGVLGPCDPRPKVDDVEESPDLDARVEAAIERHWSAGAPLSDRPEARDRFAQTILARELRASADAIRDAIVRLQMAGRVLTENYGPKRNRKGLRTPAKPDLQSTEWKEADVHNGSSNACPNLPEPSAETPEPFS